MGLGPAKAQNPTLGRYELGAEIASGGMATVHLGRMVAPGGFVRTVAIKRLHSHYARDPELVAMFLDEARLAARAPHPNVVAVLDVVAADGEVFIVMEYLRGESVAQLARAAAEAGEEIPLRIALGVISGVLSGLHAAHEAKSERGEPLGIVHRDVSPQNILVGADGVPRVVDFGIAKAKIRLHSTKDGRLKGKLRYMAPEQLQREGSDRRGDVYATSVVLWEMLTGRSLFVGEDPSATIGQVLSGEIAAPRSMRPSLPEGLDEIVLRGLAYRPEDRFPTALAMAEALDAVDVAATPREIGAWVLAKAGQTLDEHAAKIAVLEAGTAPTERAVRARADSKLDTQLVGGAAAPAGLLFEATDPAAPSSRPPPPSSPLPSPRRRRSLVGGAVATLAAVALTTCAIVGSRARSTPVDTAGSMAEPLGSVALSAPSSEAPALADASTLPASTASTAPASGAPRAATPASRHPRPAKTARPGCDPPYFIDSDGHKQYHAKCL